MGYVGNQTTNSYTSMDKQTITGNGGTSYTLDHAVANVNEIEVFVNNVRQEPSVAYTVAGTALTMTGNVASSDDFYVVFQGKAIQTVVPPDDSVTTAKVQDNAITAAKMFSAFSNGIIELDQFRLASNFATNSATITGFERVDDATFSKLGTGMSESSGVFTFPSTGLWVVFGCFDLSSGSSDTVGYQAEVSSDSGSSYDSVAIAYSGQGTGNGSGVTLSVVNVTNASNFRFKTKTISLASGSSVQGYTDETRSSLLFIRITGAQ